MRNELLGSRYRIYIPNHVLRELRSSRLYEELLSGGVTIYQATGYWLGESEDVSIHEIFGNPEIGDRLEMLAQEMLCLGEDAVLIDMHDVAVLYSNEAVEAIEHDEGAVT